ncbi:MAG: hypothetical protein J7M25_14565 [Deltaproteobacteria bacterium]|nr:hypothetical protein [Deltaproteobacteria bacterium]
MQPLLSRSIVFPTAALCLVGCRTRFEIHPKADSGTDGQSQCGNGTVDPGEDCDPQSGIKPSCTEVGAVSGTLSCQQDCTWDQSDCNFCGNGTVEQDQGEDCDDGNQTPGDGCSDVCHTENLYRGFATVEHGRIKVRGQTIVLLGAAGLPQDVSDPEAIQAGFNFLDRPGPTGHRGMWFPMGQQDPKSIVEPYLDDINLIAWLGPDEPLWNGIEADELKAQFSSVLDDIDPYGRLRFINHAPRGSQDEPSNFDLLLDYLPLSQVVSMDMYPIPAGNGHSILADHQDLDAVGAQADLLAGLVSQSGLDESVVMILEGAGMGRIPSERWEMAEHWRTEPSLSPNLVRFAVTGDFDGDGTAELALGYDGSADGDQDRILVYDFAQAPFGGPVQELVITADLSLDATTIAATAGDWDGDGDDDLMIIADQGHDKQDFWLVPSTQTGLDQPHLSFRSQVPDVVLSVIRHFLAADFDGDQCDDLMASYDYPDGTQAWILIGSRCSGFDDFSQAISSQWYLSTTSQLDLERVKGATAADTNGDGLADLILAYHTTNEHILILQATSQGTGQPPRVLLDVPQSNLNLNNLRAFQAGDVTANGHPDLVMAFKSQLDLDVFVADPSRSNLTVADLDRWLTTTAVDSSHVMADGLGDLDGDGADDLVLASRDRTDAGALSLDVAFSTQRFFGARDPLQQELWFMALDAMIRGAQGGVVFWCQQFVSSDSAAWQRLTAAVSHLSKLEPVLAADSVSHEASGDLAWWWLSGADSSYLLVARETRQPATNQDMEVPVPQSTTGNQVEQWDVGTDTFSASSAHLSGTKLIDPSPMRPFEVRIYRIR